MVYHSLTKGLCWADGSCCAGWRTRVQIPHAHAKTWVHWYTSVIPVWEGGRRGGGRDMILGVRCQSGLPVSSGLVREPILKDKVEDGRGRCPQVDLWAATYICTDVHTHALCNTHTHTHTVGGGEIKLETGLSYSP